MVNPIREIPTNDLTDARVNASNRIRLYAGVRAAIDLNDRLQRATREQLAQVMRAGVISDFCRALGYKKEQTNEIDPQ